MASRCETNRETDARSDRGGQVCTAAANSEMPASHKVHFVATA